MGAPLSRLLVAVDLPRAVIRVCGRASFNCSADFKTLVYELEGKGCRQFVLELTDCTIMDSTFLGILARFAQHVAKGVAPGSRITLWNPSVRILDLLDNLAVKELFQIEQGRPPLGGPCQTELVCNEPKDKLAATRASLEAHETLMGLNPANIGKFKDVVAFMAEDLKRLEKQGG